MNTNIFQTFSARMCFGAATLTALAGVACAQVQPVLIFEHAGLGTMLQHDKDQGVLKAMAMLPDRLGELPLEIPGMDQQIGGLLKLAATTIHRPMRVAIVSNQDDPTDGGFGYGVVISIETANQGDAEQLDALLHMAIAQSDMPYEPKPSKQYSGQSEIATPFAMFRFGPASTKDQWRYQITAGATGDVPAIFENNLTSTANFTPVMRLRMDPAGLDAALTMAENSVPDHEHQAREIIHMIRDLGLTESDGPKLDSVMGYTKTHSVSQTIITNMRQFADDLGISTTPLTNDDIAILPQDIVFGSVGRGSYDELLKLADHFREAGMPVDEFLDEVESKLGVSLVNDIITPLGDVTAMYASDTTGGGGLTSMVMAIKLDDADRFANALTKLGSRANVAIANEEPQAAQYVEFDRWQHDGHIMLSVHAKGLPVPVEPTITISGNWMVMGMTPNATIAAIEQTSGKARTSILNNQHVARADVSGALKFSYMDTERLARDGYGGINLLATAIGSAVRSPGNGTRDAGIIIPNFHDTMKGVKPTIYVTQWNENDLVMRSTGDPSMVVNAAAGFGIAQNYVMPIVAAVVMPAAMNAQRHGGMNRWGMHDEMGWDHIEITPVAIEAEEAVDCCESSCEKACSSSCTEEKQ
ncbi:MAG: hypothetical protein H6815_03510 [Phycisphaeraceae bacterium]|nr:hypothetical protein [Phycisphaerales bacterium]MCB9859495.1 hypothetical protein [Phycisphaeraceae bacterium]